jgi:hypothetical protein
MAKYINVDEFGKRLQHISGTRLDCLDYVVAVGLTVIRHLIFAQVVGQ